MSLKDKTVVLSGGTGGLGRNVVKAFLDEGANVITTYYKGYEFSAMKSDEIFSVDNFSGIRTNLSDRAEVELFREKVINKYGRADILVNIAGGFSGGKPIAEMPYEELDKMLEINLKAAYNMCRAFIPGMITNKSGKIVNIGAVAGTKASPNMAAYAASKAALINMTLSIAGEVKKHNINVNIILPGTIDTPANRSAMPDADFSKWVSPDSIAELIVFLSSGKSDDITGAVIPITGRD